MELPTESAPVLAKINLGISTWYEIVHYDEELKEWCSFCMSDTFENGETVVSWEYPAPEQFQ